MAQRTDSGWVKPIYFQEPTLSWLNSLEPWPETAYEDFDKIAKHNAKCAAVSTQP